MFPKDIESKLSMQDYAPKPAIEGVKFVELKEFADDGGSFLELCRLDKGVCGTLSHFEAKQMNYSRVMAGVIKATHIHKNQDDVWFVPPHERILVGLKDLRAGSKTEGVVMRFVLGAGKPRLLFIPRGVAHGLANPWQETATIIYFVNQHFSAEADKCDEYRLPADFLGKDFWEIKRE